METSTNTILETPRTFVNNCHDSEIISFAQQIGVRNPDIINKALSLGEGPYDSQEKAELFLQQYREQELEQKRLNRQKQYRSALSKKQKQCIMQRYGIEI
jgi:hypothetical protein